MKPTQELVQIALEISLQPGHTRRTQCPWCRNSERSMTISRQALGLLYRCHRASCDHSGFVPTAGEILPVPDKDSPRERATRPFTGSIYPLSQASQRFFAERYELSADVATGFIQETESEYVLPIYDPLGHERGVNVRQPWKGAPLKGADGKPKSLIYMSSASPVQAFYYEDSTLPMVVCEDQLSAIKVADSGLANAVALLGTHMDATRVQEIAMLHPKEVIIAMDEDATSKAFLAARKWGLAFRKIRVTMLGKDLKDTPMADFAGVLGINE